MLFFWFMTIWIEINVKDFVFRWDDEVLMFNIKIWLRKWFVRVVVFECEGVVKIGKSVIIMIYNVIFKWLIIIFLKRVVKYFFV